jgi:hypothetical protein
VSLRKSCNLKNYNYIDRIYALLLQYFIFDNKFRKKGYTCIIKKLKSDNYSSDSTKSVQLKKTLETLPRGWISLSEDELIEAYNYASSVLSRKAIKVSIINPKGRQSPNSGILLGEQRNGNYWIMVTEKGDYWLLPKVNFRINSFSKDTVESLFKFNRTYAGTLYIAYCRHKISIL